MNAHGLAQPVHQAGAGEQKPHTHHSHSTNTAPNSPTHSATESLLDKVRILFTMNACWSHGQHKNAQKEGCMMADNRKPVITREFGLACNSPSGWTVR
jgi:hypothetical protein